MQDAEFEQVYDFGNLYAGFLKARRGKRHKPSVAKFEANLLEALCLLSEMLKPKHTDRQIISFSRSMSRKNESL
mgnify:CR=1 FL=1